MVSVVYQSMSSVRLTNLFSRTQICFRCPLGCWMIVSHSPSDVLPVASISGRQPNCQSGTFGETATTVKSSWLTGDV